MTYSEFRDYDDDMIVFCSSMTRNVEAQLKFNRLVAEKLGLSYAMGVKASPKKEVVLEDVSIA